MFCIKCGASLTNEDLFCRACGAPVDKKSSGNVGEQSFNNSSVGSGTTNTVVRSVHRKKKKSDPITNIMIAVCGLVVVASVVIIVVLITKGGQSSEIKFNGDYNDSSDKQNIDNSSSIDNNQSVNGNTNNNTNNSNPKLVDYESFAVKFRGYTFRIPTNIVYETLNNSILLEDENGTWSTYIEVLDGSYDVIQSQKNELQMIYQNQGFASSSPSEKNINGVNFITLEVSKGGNNALLGISNASATHFFGATVYDNKNSFDYNILNIISKILGSATYSNDTNNISSFENIDMSEISDIAK